VWESVKANLIADLIWLVPAAFLGWAGRRLLGEVREVRQSLADEERAASKLAEHGATISAQLAAAQVHREVVSDQIAALHAKVDTLGATSNQPSPTKE
jgi:acetyl-CoA carboxylase beta subunit